MSTYPDYKDSGAEIVGEIPAHWKLVRLKHLGSIKYGLGQPPREEEAGVPFLRATNVHRGSLSAVGLMRVDASDVPSGRDAVLSEGDILVVRSGAYTGDSAMVTREYSGAIAGYDMVLRLNRAEPRFIRYGLLAPVMLQNQIFPMRMRAAQPHLNREELGDVLVPLPPLDEQRQLAAYLDRKTAEVDTLIRKKQALIARLGELRAALIHRAVTKGLDPDVPMKASGVEWLGEVPEHWAAVQLRYVADLSSGNGITSEAIEPEGDYPVFGGNGVRGFTTEYTHDGHFALIGRQGALCGNINFANGKFWASEHAVVVTPHGSNRTVWLGHLLRAMNLGQYSVAAAQPGISVESIKALHIPIPPVEEQVQIEGYITEKADQIETVLRREDRLVDRLRELRTSLISEVVTGKIDVRAVGLAEAVAEVDA